MMATISPNQSRSRIPRWHRYLGISGALFALLLSTTGILLNHTSDLELDNHHVQSGWLLNHYGLQVPDSASYAVGAHWISQLGQRLYLDEKEIAADTAPLIGALPYSGMIVVVTETALWLLGESGTLIERLEYQNGLPGAPIGLGITKENSLAIQTRQDWYTTNDALYPWNPISGPPSQIATATDAPMELQQKQRRSYLGEGLSLERLLLDLHTGRIFGSFGVYLVDLMALVLCGLAITGLTTWFKRKRQSTQLRIRTETNSA
jgi:hypothetical protein